MYPEAIAELQKALLLGGGTVERADLGYAYAVAGRRAEALKVLNELKQLSKHPHVFSYGIAEIYVGLGENDLAFTWLQKACEQRSAWLAFLKVEPRLDPLHADPRFADLLRRVGLPP